MSQGAQTAAGKPATGIRSTVQIKCYGCRKEHSADCYNPSKPVSTCTPITDPSGAVRGIHRQCPYCGFSWDEWKPAQTPGH